MATNTNPNRTTVNKLYLSCATALTLALAQPATANNIQITNVGLVDNTGTTVKVQFDISWENSWRGGPVINWDAAWVFVKYKYASGIWGHAKLSLSGHTEPSGCTIDPGLQNPGTAHNATTNPVIGMFLRRSVDGTGAFAATGVQLAWDYSAQGIVTTSDIVEIKVFGIEMVHVNQGAFAAGSGGTENNAFMLTTINTATANTAPTGVGSLGGMAGGFPNGQTAPIASWPNGYNAFYCMKYEVAQQQYVDFLNTLNRAQQNSRTGSDLSIGITSVSNVYVMSNTSGVVDRNGIRCNTAIDGSAPVSFFCDLNGNGIGGEADDGQWVANGFMSWDDLGAYLDWSGLRYMTELEFEKACRGPVPPLPNEYPWGTTTLNLGAMTVSGDGTVSESIATNYSTSDGNAAITNNIPTRVGIFAAHPSNTGRISAGSGYYGTMEMAGNVWERVISLGGPVGGQYTGAHGNGTLWPGNGDYDVNGWPPIADDNMAAKGGGHSSGLNAINQGFLRTSDRNYLITDSGFRISTNGGRGVRTAP